MEKVVNGRKIDADEVSPKTFYQIMKASFLFCSHAKEEELKKWTMNVGKQVSHPLGLRPFGRYIGMK